MTISHHSTNQPERTAANVRLFILVWASSALVTCAGPLPAENPKTELDERAEPVEIEVSSTQDPKSDEESGDGASSDPAERVVFKDVGLQTPECALYDPQTDSYLVSNIHGSPVEKDGNGFISQLRPDGSVAKLDFIKGGRDGVALDAPKGMLIAGQTLHVTDIDRVRSFDLATGKPLGEVVIPGSTFLNELATDDQGTIYVTDSGLSMGASGLEPNGTDAIYRLEDNTVSTLVKGPELKGPNGVIAHDGLVSIVTFGSDTLVSYDAQGQPTATTSLPTGGLDGLVQLSDGSLLISSWQGKAVYHGQAGQTFTAIVSDVNSPADIGYDPKRQRVLIPLFLDNEVWAVPLAASPSPSTAPDAPKSPASSQPAPVE